jgi:hypothetical protein
MFYGLEGDLEGMRGNLGSAVSSQPHHHHRNSMDGSSSLQINQLSSESLETKKVMAEKNIQEIAFIDPRQAKRYAFNTLQVLGF